MAIAGTAPSLNERHVARTYRSCFLSPNQFSVGASGGSISGGQIALQAGEDVSMMWVPPYDVDPSFALKFRFHYKLQTPTLKPSKSAIGISFTGAGSLAAGAVMTHAGSSYTLDATVTALGAGVEVGAVTAVVSGTGHDLTPLDVLTLVVPNANIDAIAASTLTQAGADETDVNVAVQFNISNNDGTVEGYTNDPSTRDPLTTPVGAFTPASTYYANVSPTGSLTLPSTTRRNWSAGVYLQGDTACPLISILGLEIAYVPFIGGVTGYPSHIPAAAWSV